MARAPKFPDLAKKSVFITGGGAGIGANLTEAFLQQGAKVAFVQRSDATAFCDDMERKYGNRPIYIPCDVTQTSALKKSIEQASKENGTIDVLINNAADDDRHRTEEVTEQYWEWSQAINLKAYFFACQAVLKYMREAGHGSIINMTSISYMLGGVGYPSYVAANAGINGLTRSLAREFGVENIRVNCIAPGWVLTEKQLEKWATCEALKAHMELQCLKEHLKPSDIEGTALFLASAASRMITGQVIVVDGGVVTTG